MGRGFESLQAHLTKVLCRNIMVHIKSNGVWLSLVERSVRDREVAGSNPVTPTLGRYESIFLFCYVMEYIHQKNEIVSRRKSLAQKDNKCNEYLI